MTIYTVNRLLKEFGMEKTGYLAYLSRFLFNIINTPLGNLFTRKPPSKSWLFCEDTISFSKKRLFILLLHAIIIVFLQNELGDRRQ